MRQLAWIFSNRDAEQFTFIWTWVIIASYNVSVFAMNVVVFSLQIFLRI